MTGVFSIPGGEIDEGEDKFEAAVREIKEETGLSIKKADLKYLGYYKYVDYKDLEIFLYELDEELDLSSLKCDSFFESPNGKMLPEINGFVNIVYPEEKRYFFFSTQKVLEKVEKDWPNYFSI
jgi:8-oxo-dGTP pyrophosphatase MutT (NUDIX family)